MATKLEFKGKDVDQAITNACEKLGVHREDLDIEIRSTGSSGIFGLCRKEASVLVCKKSNGKDATAEGPPSLEPEKDIAPVETKEAPPGDETAGNEEKSKPSPSPPAQKKKPADKKKVKRDKRPQEQEAALTPEILEQIKNDLSQTLILMNFPSEIAVEEENNKALVRISGDHVESLTANDGQILDSLQYLLRKIIGKKFPEKIMFTIDAGNFRETRRKELQDLALKLAEEVKVTEKTRTIPPLNPSERRIVHLVLQEDKTIRSRSVGDGLFKKILIYLPGKGRGRKRPPRRRSRNN